MLENQYFHGNWATLLSIFVGLVYCIYGLIKKKVTRDSLADILTIMFATLSLICGLKFSIQALFTTQHLITLINLEDSEPTFTIFGGFTAAWIAIWELAEKFKEL